MNTPTSTQEKIEISSLFEATANNLRAELAKKRAKRQVEGVLQSKDTDTETTSNDFTIKIPTKLSKVDTVKTIPTGDQEEDISLPKEMIPANPVRIAPSVSVTQKTITSKDTVEKIVRASLPVLTEKVEIKGKIRASTEADIKTPLSADSQKKSSKIEGDVTIEIPPVVKTKYTEVDLELDFSLDFTEKKGTGDQLDLDRESNQIIEKKASEVLIPKAILPTAKALDYASKQTDNIQRLLNNDTELPPHITAESIFESVAIMQTQEEQWESLKINQISIPTIEVSLWSSFFKIFTQIGAERHLDHPFEKGDTFELKIPGFHMFNITRIRKSEKQSLTFCVVQSKLNPEDTVYIFEVLVKLPIRAGGILEIYRNRSNGPVLINRWKIDKVFLKRPKNSQGYQEKGNKSGILGILGL